MAKTSVSTFKIIKNTENHRLIVGDLIAVEEPLEIILDYGPLENRKSVNLAITMRTPGNDLELVYGFLATEQLINEPEELVSVRHCRTVNSAVDGNTVKVQLHPQVHFEPGKSLRHFYINSSCGICGKTSVDSVMETCTFSEENSHLLVRAEVIKSLPEVLREKQMVFNRTGGLHAAALFDQQGKPVWWREDVGRHNAVDKVLGAAFAQNKWPLNNFILLVSGRISFELVQKALRAGVRFMAAIGAPSSLAVELARRADMTLVGFLSEKRFNVYHGANRINETSEVVT